MAEGKFSALRRSMAVPLRSAPPRPVAESAVAIYIPADKERRKLGGSS